MTSRKIKPAGLPLADLKDWQPPCSRDPIAFSARGYTISHNDPLEFRQLPSVREEIPPFSVCPSPYRWLREENFRSICEDEKLDIRECDTKDKGLGGFLNPIGKLNCFAISGESWSRRSRLCFSIATTATHSMRA